MRSARFLPTLALPAALILASAATFSAPQKRVQKDAKVDFPALLTKVGEAWKTESWGEASKSLQTAVELVAGRRRESIRASFPNPGAGWTLKPDNSGNAAMMAALGMSHFTVEGNYTGPENARMTVTAMIDSPLVQMMSLVFNNPAMRDKKIEVIEYEQYKALLKKQGDKRFELQILIDGSVLQADVNGMTDDELLLIFNEDAVKKVATALKK